MKFYIADKWGEYARVLQLKEALEQRGHSCTCDWASISRQVHEEGFIEDTKQSALADLQGVKDADILILVAKDKGGQGRWIEYGYALALGKPILVWDCGTHKNGIFLQLARRIDTADLTTVCKEAEAVCHERR